jgi:uncharacterized protein (DUF1330 family)
MKINKKVLYSIIIAVFAITINACMVQKKKESKNMIGFTKDNLVEIAFATIKPDMLKQFNNGYIPKIVPIISEYGGRFVVLLQKDEVIKGDIDSFTVALLQWPSVESFIKTGKDSRVPGLLKVRNETLAYINEANFFKLQQDVSFEPRPASVYELVASKKAVSLESIVKKSKGKILMHMEPAAKSFGSFKPEEAYLIEWPGKEHHSNFDKLVKNADFYDDITNRITAKYAAR